MKQKFSKLVWLFFTNLFISAFTFGGGYVVIPMIRKYFVQKKRVLQEEDVMDMAAIAQSSPGAIAVNLSVLAGYRTAGLSGAVVSLIASILPALFLLSLVSMWYDLFAASAPVAAVLKGMEAGVTALIVDVCIDMYRAISAEGSRLLKLLVPITFFCSYFFQITPALLLLFGCFVTAGACSLRAAAGKRKA